jgi:hypothetical protein
MSVALDALQTALVTALKAAAGVFETRVYKDIGGSDATYPYVVYNFAGGGDDNVRKGKKTANILIQVKCVSDDSLQSLTGASQIDTALDDGGYQDSATETSALDTAAQTLGWRICTVTAEDLVTLTELFANADPNYHDGKIYRFIMEES